ncbi:heavy-metal-associated domain-containing protein [Sulfuricurvum sp.]|uniref:heavy-metal-associated domain-containing protein n=1 Tax=Sulfuricurvum sp. TaxID=2025608 RepID=UPI0019C6B7C8|nr:heavy-metal-associated domain-containing protein [Sulfuricurvum sp.]MBD3798763.1 heavy-metal-associated domain-containing protein [Campylobacterota bacterium]MBD3805702.1 heavy-metal-associated domain-containing protein [Sulfuricurvum sp.]
MKQTFEVANIRCGGCVNTITKALQEVGFTEVEVDLSCEPRKVTVEIANEVQSAYFKAILRSLGYPLATDERGFGEEAILKAKSFVSCAIGKIN